MSEVVGAALLLVASFMIGVSLRRAESSRIVHLRATVQLFSHARRKIDLFGTPADDLFSDFSDGFDTETQKMLSELPVSESLPILAGRLKPYGGTLTKFAEEIGCGYREDALHLCDYCIETTESLLASAEEAYARRKKMYISLPILLAISLIVLFI